MSNNSWKQYGGISKLNKFNTINVSTVIADQFISRSVNPTYQFLNGTIEVSLDLIATQYITAGNNIFARKNIVIKEDIYANNKLFFGDNQFNIDKDSFIAFDSNSTHAYVYGDASNIGINTTLPKTAFNVTGTVDSVTDILTVESGNVYIRNIIAQNKNQRGIVVDASDNSSTIHFYNDVSTNQTNAPNATIQYQSGGILTTSTSERILTSSKAAQLDTSGGVLIMDASGTFLTTIGEISIQTDRGYLLNTSGGRILLDDISGNMYLDTSNLFVLTCTEGTFQGNHIIVDTSGGNIEINSGDTKLNTFLKISPPERGISTELLYDETVSIYDNSNQQFLPNVYNDPSIFTGNATTFIGKDPSANTFIHMNPATNKLGTAIGGGMAPYDSTRAMSMFGLTDTHGKYIPSLMTVSSSNTHKYLSTMGINTYAPRSEEYVMDVNGAIHIGNGEINTIIESNYEITSMHFSRTSPNSGIAVGSPSTKNGTNENGDQFNNYKQFLLYTHDGGKSWTKSDILELTSTDEQSPIIFQHAHVFDSSYSIVTSSGYIFITYNGGVTWRRLEPQIGTTSITSGIHTSTITQYNPSTLRIIIAYDDNIKYVDVSINNTETVLKPNLTGGISSISTIQSVSDIFDNYLYYITSSGLFRYTISDASYININTNSYNSVYVYDSSHVVAVGDNIISYTINTTDWTDISYNQTNIDLTDITLQSVFIADLNNAVAVGSSGEFIYSTKWQNGVWQMIPDNILNTSGMKDRIRGAENNLKSIYMPDINTFIVADAITPFEYVTPDILLDVSSQLGYSKIQYCFFPNLFNRTNNTVIDVSGNMIITGDIELFEGELLVNTIDCEPHTTYLSGTLDIGTKTHVVNIGKTDNLNDINLSQSFNNYSSVVNIGAIIPNELNKNLINIGNYSGLSNYSNRINIGGGKDLVVISGDVRYTNTTISRSKNKGFQINDYNLHEGVVMYLTDKKGVNFDNIVTDASYQEVLTVLTGDSVFNDISYNGQTSEYELDVINYVDVSYTDVLGWTTIKRAEVNSSLIEYLIQDYTTNPFNSGAGAGIFITDNFDRNAGYLKVSQDMNGWVMKPTLIDSKTLKIDVNNLILRNTSYNSTTDVSGIHDIHNGIVVLTRSAGGANGDSDYILGVKQFDISNVLVRDSVASSNILQVVNTKLHVMDDVSMNNTLYVKENVTFDNDLLVKGDVSFNSNIDIDGVLDVSSSVVFRDRLTVYRDVSMNGNVSISNNTTIGNNLFVGGDVSFNGDVDISGVLRATYMQNNYVINTVTSDYEFIVTTDMSLNGTLLVNGDASFNSNMDIYGRVAIGKNNPLVTLDICGNDAIRIPVGNTLQRPSGTLTEAANGGYIRYNIETHQFEGFGPGNSWGSLGGVVNVKQNTKITAESSPGNENNQLRFYTGYNNAPQLQMIIDASYGGVAIGTGYATDVSNNNLDISNSSLLIEGKVGIGTNAPQAVLDVSGNVRFIGDVSMNGNVNIDNNKTFTVGTGASIMGGSLDISGTLDVSSAVALHTTLRVDGATTIGDSLLLNSDNAVLSIGLDSDFNITHDGNTGATIHATPLNITSAGDSTYSTTSGILNLNGANGVIIDGSSITMNGNLDVSGQITAVSFNAISDIRHKENIEDLETPLTKINNIRGVNFNFINDTTKRLHSGVIAQEVDPHMPELINKSDSNKWSVNYDGFIPYLIESVKTLTKENQSLTQKVASLESKIDFIMQNLHP